MDDHCKSTAILRIVVLMTVLLAACSSAAQLTPPQSTSTPTSTSPPTSTNAPTRTAPPATLAPSLQVSSTIVAPSQCAPTIGDELSPTYEADAPVRSAVGQGHILTGIVRSSADCAPIPGAKIELWSEEPGEGHPDEYRSTIFTDSSGAYRFECNPTDHIHMLISTEGYRSIASNAYHTEGRPEGIFDIVLEPDTL